MSVSRMSAVLLCLALCACGGGGSGGSDAPEDDGGPAADSTGAVVIQFPATAGTRAVSGTVTFSGMAEDGDGVAAVTVNGQAAMLEAAPGAPAATAGPATRVNWNASIALHSGVNTVSVALEDARGDTVRGAESRSVTYLQVPIQFHLDAGMHRVVGAAYNTGPGFGRALVDYDYVNSVQTIYTTQFPPHIASCFRARPAEFLYLEHLDTLTFRLFRYRLESDSSVTIATLFPDPAAEGFDEGVFLGNLVCDDAHGSAYLLMSYFRDPGSGGNLEIKSNLFQIDLATGEVSVLAATDPQAATPWRSSRIALTRDAIIAAGWFNEPGPLARIALADGSLSWLLPEVAVEPVALAPALDDNRIYVVHHNDVYALDLEQGTYALVSAVDPLDPLVFGQVRAAAYDAENQRLIVSDEALDMLIAVDVVSGMRTELLSGGIGEGLRLIAPRGIAVTRDGSRAYVVDDGGNAAERLVEVELASGDRREVGVIDQPRNVTVGGLALDEAGQRVYVAIQDQVLGVDLTNGLTEVVASDTVGSGEPLSLPGPILFDAAANRLLLANEARSILSIDLATGTREVFSAAGVRGDGPAFAALNSMAFNADHSLLYVTNQATTNVMSVDAENGDRRVVVSECLDHNGADELGDEEITLNAITFDPTDNSFYIQGDSLLRYAVESGRCEVVQARTRVGVTALTVTGDGRFYAASFGSLGEYDPVHDQYLIVSK